MDWWFFQKQRFFAKKRPAIAPSNFPLYAGGV
jgi:hypothetical protein